MTRFKKKAELVEAMQWLGGKHFKEVKEFVPEEKLSTDGEILYIHGRGGNQGTTTVFKESWLVKFPDDSYGVTLRVMSDDTFHAAFEEVDSQPAS